MPKRQRTDAADVLRDSSLTSTAGPKIYISAGSEKIPSELSDKGGLFFQQYSFKNGPKKIRLKDGDKLKSHIALKTVSVELSENRTILVSKKTVNTQYLVTIFADDTGFIRATMTDNEGSTQQAFFVKGMNSIIDCSNEEMISWLRNALSESCYLTVSTGDVHVHVRIEGGVKHKFYTFAFGASQVALGAGISVAYPGVATPLVSGLLSSGLNTMQYSLSTPESEINYDHCLKQAGASFAVGAVMGVVPSASTAGAASSMMNPLTTFAQRTASSAALGVLTPLVNKHIVTPIIRGELPRFNFESLQQDLRPKELARNALSGAVAGNISSLTSAVAIKQIEIVSLLATSEGNAALNGAIAGGFIGAASGAATKLATNAVEKATGQQKSWTDGVAGAAAQAGTLGAIMGGMQSTVRYKQNMNQKPDQRKKEKLSAEKIDEKRKKQRDAKLHQISDDDKRREEEVEIRDESSKERESIERKTDRDEKSHKEMRKEQEKEALLAKMSQQGSKAKNRRVLEAEIKRLDEARLTNSRADIDVFFTDDRLENLAKKLSGQDINVPHLKELLRGVEKETLYSISRDKPDAPLAVVDRISKQLGHVRGELGFEYSSPDALIGGGRIVVPEDQVAGMAVDLPHAVVTNLQGASPGEAIRHKMYAHCIALCESSEVRNDALIHAIVEDYNNFNIEHRIFDDRTFTPFGTVLQLTSDFLERIRKLSDGGSQILSTGWSGAPGHATAHRFERHNDQITIRIYNGGYDPSFYHTRYEANADFVHTYSFEPVPITSPALNEYISKLLEIQRAPEMFAVDAMYRPRGLTPIADQTQSPIMPIQQSGNCSWHNFTAAQAASFKESAPELIMREDETMRQVRLAHQGFPQGHLEKQLDLVPTTEYAVRFTPGAAKFTQAPPDPGFARELGRAIANEGPMISAVVGEEREQEGEEGARRDRGQGQRPG